ncbi:N-acetylneuraminate epimerase precursor [Thalassoglobus neptunius]|uniref:N-acetylneuraminate epimerase n=1 Tax=Thalassoglobus neptunius TaxID=1938619 RepID=A0A5C5X572_9PLAN|nr:N-acetylneuraminate epimerase precursor [Thalassoglobus neptunius]
MKKSFVLRSALCLIACGVTVSVAQRADAHFIFLAPQATKGETTRIEVYFGEDASADDPAFLKYTEGMNAWAVQQGKEMEVLEIDRKDDSVSTTIPADETDKTIIVATHDLGVMDRGDTVFRLKYYAKTGPSVNSSAWTSVDTSKALKLDVIPEETTDGVNLQVLFNGEAVEGSEVVASGPELFEFEGTTGESGTIVLPIDQPGLYSIRAKHVEPEAGEFDGKEYPETRHYTTLTLRVQSDLSQAARRDLQPLEQPVTSFGGAILGDKVYIYGGHSGSAHSYSNEEQGHTLLQLNLGTGQWNELVDGPPLQGLAMVAHGDRLYRIGGFTAKNSEGEEHDLWSRDTVEAYDLTKNKWGKMPSLPEPRSSFDAAVLNDTIYVIGGWQLQGESDEVWHQTAWSMDLNAEDPQWTALPEPPFQRRALAVAAFNDKLYVIGGMQSEGGPTTAMNIYDPQTETWSEGPELVVEASKESDDDSSGSRFSAGMTGFGASAFAAGGHLYASTFKGNLQRLSDDGSQWEIVAKTPTARFFHRMLPVSDHELLVVGGASMAVGKFEEVEILDVSKE